MPLTELPQNLGGSAQYPSIFIADLKGLSY